MQQHHQKRQQVARLRLRVRLRPSHSHQCWSSRSLLSSSTAALRCQQVTGRRVAGPQRWAAAVAPRSTLLQHPLVMSPPPVSPLQRPLVALLLLLLLLLWLLQRLMIQSLPVLAAALCLHQSLQPRTVLLTAPALLLGLRPNLMVLVLSQWPMLLARRQQLQLLTPGSSRRRAGLARLQRSSRLAR